VCLVVSDDGAQDRGRVGAVGRVRRCVVLPAGRIFGQGCLGADAGEQVIGEQLRDCSRLPVRLHSMHRQSKRYVSNNLALNDRAIHPIRSTPQPLPNGDQPLTKSPLLLGRSTIVHDPYRHRYHVAIDPCQFGQQFPVFPDHG
jgi:hypothetical protein